MPKYTSAGQTLIETVVAIFILTTGLAAGLTLAIYVFGSSADLAEQITATGLAREGIEIVRRMRDSNWRAGVLTDCGGGDLCISTWLSSPYDIQGSPFTDGVLYRVVFDSTSTGNKWSAVTANASDDFQFYTQYDGTLSHNVTFSPTNFFRKINIIYQDTNAPYSATSPLVLVRSTVWWHGKNCPRISYMSSPSDTTCRIITEEYLTNWRNY